MTVEAIHILEELLKRKNVILTGPPASGKTTIMNKVAKLFLSDQEPQGQPFHDPSDSMVPVKSNLSGLGPSGSSFATNRKVFRTTFHQNYKNRDFISGIIPSFKNPGSFEITRGILYEANEYAKKEGCAALLIIDEINRGPAIEIFGGSIVSIESDKRLLKDNTKGPYTATFTILNPEEQHQGEYIEYALSPDLYILAAMNQADTSIMALDVAFLRRWLEIPVEPDYSVLYEKFGVNKDDPLRDIPEQASDVYNVAIRALRVINEKISISVGPEYQIGHGVLCNMATSDNINGALLEIMGAWPFIKTHLEEVYYKEISDLGYVLNSGSSQSPFKTEVKDFNNRKVEVLVNKEISIENVYSLYYALTETR